jgi:Domain of unknown function (DUF4331)
MSDHFSGPAVMGDPSVDITDFYAFPSPERAGHLVLIMDVFPLATSQALFSDVVTYRFRLRPLTRSGGSMTPGKPEYTIDVRFDDAPVQNGRIVTSDGRDAGFVVDRPFEERGMRVFAGLVSDPFFMDVVAAARTEILGKLAFTRPGVNTVQFRDCLTIVVEIPCAAIVERFAGATLVGAIAETIVTRRGPPIRLERVGRPEIKNVALQNMTFDPSTRGVELRDLYNREDAFALSKEYRPLYESRLDAILAFYDGLDGATAWPPGPDGRHPLRPLLLDDYLVLDLSRPFAPGSFLEIERSLLADRPHESAGGRWLEDDIVDELLTLYVNGGRGERVADGVDAATKSPSRSFPYVREPNMRADLPMPAIAEG